jgi:hypothetical protein
MKSGKKEIRRRTAGKKSYRQNRFPVMILPLLPAGCGGGNKPFPIAGCFFQVSI